MGLGEVRIEERLYDERGRNHGKILIEDFQSKIISHFEKHANRISQENPYNIFVTRMKRIHNINDDIEKDHESFALENELHVYGYETSNKDIFGHIR